MSPVAHDDERGEAERERLRADHPDWRIVRDGRWIPWVARRGGDGQRNRPRGIVESVRADNLDILRELIVEVEALEQRIADRHGPRRDAWDKP
ncbi:hypothetical protein ACSNOI_26750 [Actinomadura kijaniata]|uniref:hypothetical protein n=1 Tax=Actinomadura kijaniata TaxID=46161 RepID=UPI003F1D1D77